VYTRPQLVPLSKATTLYCSGSLAAAVTHTVTVAPTYLMAKPKLKPIATLPSGYEALKPSVTLTPPISQAPPKSNCTQAPGSPIGMTAPPTGGGEYGPTPT